VARRAGSVVRDRPTPLTPDLAAEELAARDEIPVPGAAGAGHLQAVYLPPFHDSERSLAASLDVRVHSGNAPAAHNRHPGMCSECVQEPAAALRDGHRVVHGDRRFDSPSCANANNSPISRIP
jgi:hypothetical protein